MNKRAFIFPGQGSQYIGMGRDLFDSSKIVRDIFYKAEQILNFPITEIMFDGPMEKLQQTEITQPAIFLHSMALFYLIDDKEIDALAGHSLGEYTALVAGGALSFEDALWLVKERSEAMAEAGKINAGTMAAIIGLDREKLNEICNIASEVGIVSCANYNSPGQIVISGSKQGVLKAIELSKSNGAKLAKELIVSGAFHSPLMLHAQDKLKKALDTVEFNNSKIPIFANVSAQPVYEKDEIKIQLFNQLSSPVKWEDSIKNMINYGINQFTEIGPGKVLQGLVKRISKNVNIRGIDKYADILEKIPETKS